MTQPVIVMCPLGRFGNQLFNYCFARAYAEQYGAKFYLDRCILSNVFELTEPVAPPSVLSRCRYCGEGFEFGELNLRLCPTYFQQQKFLLYSRNQAKRWLRIKRKWLDILEPYARQHGWNNELLAHRRVGDYEGYGYTVVPEASCRRAVVEHGIVGELKFITEENPTRISEFEKAEIGFLPDFYRLMRARVLLRANSTFSWWAAVLGNQDAIYSPVVDGLPAGEHDVSFVKGNHPRFCSYTQTELHLPD